MSTGLGTAPPSRQRHATISHILSTNTWPRTSEQSSCTNLLVFLTTQGSPTGTSWNCTYLPNNGVAAAYSDVTSKETLSRPELAPEITTSQAFVSVCGKYSPLRELVCLPWPTKACYVSLRLRRHMPGPSMKIWHLYIDIGASNEAPETLSRSSKKPEHDARVGLPQAASIVSSCRRYMTCEYKRGCTGLFLDWCS